MPGRRARGSGEGQDGGGSTEGNHRRTIADFLVAPTLWRGVPEANEPPAMLGVRMSMGSGKIMVEFFSAEMALRV